MQAIYQNAKAVLIWLGPDSAGLAEAAIASVVTVSDFLCRTLGVALADLGRVKDVYQEILFQNRGALPLPSDCPFSSTPLWASLRWLYSHKYFTRVWVIQEVNAQTKRWVHCGHHKVEWSRVELVAGYIILESAFSRAFSFSQTHCWWAAIVSTERIRQPNNWLFMLYLASNFSSTDARDAIYGLFGLLRIPDRLGLLEPNYGKSVVEVYRDSVQAALDHFHNTDVLLYVTGDGTPSWVPHWNRPMLFRNPFRFGRSLPWRPAGCSGPVWRVDTEDNTLSLQGIFIDTVDFVEIYNESYFSNARIDSADERSVLMPVWRRILTNLQTRQQRTPLPAECLASIAASFSFGLDETSTPTNDRVLMHNFLAYLRLVVDNDTYKEYIPSELAEASRHADSRIFGKPVWDFKYPDSSFFITSNGLTGCCISVSEPGDVIFAPLGSTYPLVLRPEDSFYRVRGYSYVHGVMQGERKKNESSVVRLR